MADCNLLLSESELTHRFTVDRLKWELGQPVHGWLPPPPPLCAARNYYYYYYHGHPYGYPWVAASNEYMYSQGFRDGLKSVSGESTPAGKGNRGGSSCATTSSPAAAKAVNKPTTASAPAAENKSKTTSFPGDLMGFPAASYRRPLCAFPVSSDTSYDNLTRVWPFRGCRPFYFRPADPPSVRYCL